MGKTWLWISSDSKSSSVFLTLAHTPTFFMNLAAKKLPGSCAHIGDNTAIVSLSQNKE